MSKNYSFNNTQYISRYSKEQFRVSFWSCKSAVIFNVVGDFCPSNSVHSAPFRRPPSAWCVPVVLRPRPLPRPQPQPRPPQGQQSQVGRRKRPSGTRRKTFSGATKEICKSIEASFSALFKSYAIGTVMSR